MPISIVYTKIRLTMLCLSGFELYSHWVPLILRKHRVVPIHGHLYRKLEREVSRTMDNRK